MTLADECDHQPLAIPKRLAKTTIWCRFCSRAIVPDYEWQCWVTIENDAAKWQRKKDHQEECGRQMRIAEELRQAEKRNPS